MDDLQMGVLQVGYRGLPSHDNIPDLGQRTRQQASCHPAHENRGQDHSSLKVATIRNERMCQKPKHGFARNSSECHTKAFVCSSRKGSRAAFVTDVIQGRSNKLSKQGCTQKRDMERGPALSHPARSRRATWALFKQRGPSHMKVWIRKVPSPCTSQLQVNSKGSKHGVRPMPLRPCLPQTLTPKSWRNTLSSSVQKNEIPSPLKRGP